MKTAYEAFTETTSRVIERAQEFITTEVNPAVSKVIETGKYEVSLCCEYNINDPVGKKIVDALKNLEYIVDLNQNELTIKWAAESDGDLYPTKDPVTVKEPIKVGNNWKNFVEEAAPVNKDKVLGVVYKSRDLMRYLDDLPNCEFEGDAAITVATTSTGKVRLTIWGGEAE